MPAVLIQSRKVSYMTDPRRAVLARMKELGWTKYKLLRELERQFKDAPGQNAVYSFLRKTGPSDMSSGYLAMIFKVLGLEIMPKRPD